MSRLFKVDYIPDPKRGRPLWDAKIFIGVPNEDPTVPSNQIQLTGDIGFPLGGVIEIPQPVRTNNGGVTVYNNSPVLVNNPGEPFAIAVYDRFDNLVYNFPNVDGDVAFNSSSQEELLWGDIFPEVGILEAGQTLPAGTDFIRYVFDGEARIFALDRPVVNDSLVLTINQNPDGTGEITTDDQNYTFSPAQSVTTSSLPTYTDLVFDSVADMIAGNPITPSQGDTCSTGGSTFICNVNSPSLLSDFTIIGNPFLDDFITDESNVAPAIVDAMSTLSVYGGAIEFSARIYEHTESISVANRSGIRFFCNTTGDSSSGARLRYTGPQNDSLIQVEVQTTSHSFSADGITFDANDLAGYCLILRGINNPAGLRRGGEYGSITFVGYRLKGWVIGDPSDTLADAQFQTIHVNRLFFLGGAINEGADGLHVNAQNLEWLSIDNMYIDPPSNGRNHRNHIRQIAGGIQIGSLLSTRAGTVALISDYAIYSQDQIVVGCWRSEDRYLVNMIANDPNAPSYFGPIVQRPENPSETVSSDPVILVNRAEAGVTFMNPYINGSLAIGATTEKNVNVFAFRGTRSGAEIRYLGPSNQNGLQHSVESGALFLRGSSPSLNLTDETGVTKWKVDNGTICNPRINLTPSATENNYNIGDGNFFRLSPTATSTINGIDIVNPDVNSGRRLTFVNVSANDVILNSDSGASDTQNRFRLKDGLAIVMQQDDVVEMIYDRTTTRWRAWKVT